MSTIKRYGCVRGGCRKSGRGFVNNLINKLPFELHLPGGYQYCGPGTKLEKRLARKDPGINKLDIACKQHDIQYLNHLTDLKARHTADKELEYAAWNRVKSKDAGIKEKAAALLVTNIMKAKRRFGMGCSVDATKKKRKRHPKKTKKKIRRKVAFGAGVVHKVRNVLRNAGGDEFVTNNRKKATTVALQAARKYLKAAGGKKNPHTAHNSDSQGRRNSTIDSDFCWIVCPRKFSGCRFRHHQSCKFGKSKQSCFDGSQSSQ